METIRKKICVDRLLSHRCGIVPYIPKDEDYDGIRYVNTVSSESNYGSFPCDFTFVDSHEVFDKESGLSYRENVEISKMRYLDVISRYSRSNEIISNGTKLKKVHYLEDANSCDENERSRGESGGPTPPGPSPEPCYTDCAWVENNGISKFNCSVVDSLFLIKNDNGFYFINPNCEMRYNELILIYGPTIDDYADAPEEDRSFFEKYLYFIGEDNNGAIFCHNNIIVIDEYDEYIKNEEKWNSWWSENWAICSFNVFYDRWEKYVFDPNYHHPASLKFLYDVEKYVIGKVNVPESYGGIEINGVKVPEYVFYLNYMDYLRWFVENEEYSDSNDSIRKEWDKRGGNGFKNFLYSISPKFFNENINPTHGDVIYFTFTQPNIEIPVSFCNEFYNETSYLPYEYSVVDNNIVNGTKEYVRGFDGNVESALTPAFITFPESGETSIKVESKLPELECNDVYYIDDNTYGVFNTFSNGACLFECTYYTGYSTGNVSKYTSGCVKYYAKTSGNTWNEVKSIRMPEKYVSTTTPESKPKTHSGAYQVVGIRLIDSSVTTSNIVTTDKPPVYSDDGRLKIVSSITTYNKTVRNKYSWCECKKIIDSSNTIKCGDGEDINFNGANKYRNLLLLSCVPSASESENAGDRYYFMIKYDNGYTNIGGNKQIDYVTNSVKTLSLPYVVGREVNLESYTGDFEDVSKYDMVINEELVDDVLVIDYVMGATTGAEIETSGIHYRDRYRYNGNMKKRVVIDGVYDAEIIYESVELSPKNLVYSEDLQSYRKCNTSNIIGMEVGTQWTSESSVRAYLFTDDTFDNLMEYPKISVDISYNRGNAAAWEKHFKLSECNTFEDLENYGNNYFNL